MDGDNQRRQERQVRQVFDASSIITALIHLREKAIDILNRQYTPSLAYYEIGNAIWKDIVLKKGKEEIDAANIMNLLSNIISHMWIYEIRTAEDLSSTLKLAIELKITFYDASYIYLAKKFNAFLVSEDRELRNKARSVAVKAFSILDLC